MGKEDIPDYNLPIDPDIDLIDLRDTLIEYLTEAWRDAEKSEEPDASWYAGKVEVLEHVLTYLTDADQPLEVDGADAEKALEKIREVLPPGYRRQLQKVAMRLAYLETEPSTVAEIAGRAVGLRRMPGPYPWSKNKHG